MTKKTQRVDLPERYAICPVWMIDDPRINAAAVRLWLYLYDCGFRGAAPDQAVMQHIAGRLPYSRDDGTHDSPGWRVASDRHIRDLLNELEDAGYLLWHRNEPLHARYTVLYSRHGASERRHGHANSRHGHANSRHGASDHPYIEESRIKNDDDEGRGSTFRFNEQGARLLQIGFSQAAALEFQELTAAQFQAIVDRAQQAGPEHIGAVVTWARARIKEGWKNAENRPGRRAQRSEPRQDDTDLPEWLRAGHTCPGG